jgi:transposase
MKTLNDLKDYMKTRNKEVAALPKTARRSYPYTEEFRTALVEYHYSSGLSMNKLSAILTGNTNRQAMYWQWEQNYRARQSTGIIHGKQIRMDVASKAHYVKRYLEENISLRALGEEAGVHCTTVGTWARELRDTYQEYLTLPKGIPYIIKEEKLVHGTKNIQLIREELVKNKQILTTLPYISDALSKTVQEELQTIKQKEDAINNLVAAQEAAKNCGININTL